MQKLKIGIDAFPLCNLQGGIGYYVFSILDELIKQNNQWEFYLYVFTTEGDVEYFQQYKNVKIRKVTDPFFGHSPISLLTLPFFAWKDKVDVFWGTRQTLPLFKRKKMRTVLTLYDFVYLLYPETISSKFKEKYLKLFSPWFFKTASAIVPISYGSGHRLLRYHGLNHLRILNPPIRKEISFKEKKDVIPIISSHNLEYNGYVVTVGTIEPRKNFSFLVEKYVKILEQGSLEKVMPLVIIGGSGWKNAEIYQALTEAKERFPSHIKLLGYVSNTDLSYFLSGARYYVTLSLYEGYGMPLAEARVCGTPVVCYDQPEMREAAENDGIFLNEENLDVNLRKIFLKDPESINEKRPITTNYLNNRASAEIMSEIINSAIGVDYF